MQFFDNDGCPINFNENNGVFEVDIYLEPVSISLYENFNIYLLEKYLDVDNSYSYRFPILDENERYLFRWNKEDIEVPEFFLYDIENSAVDNAYYINKVYSKYFSEDVNYNIRSPYQVNVGFSPTEEVSYRKSLLIIREELNDDVIDQTLKFQINFYSEGIEEDVRYKIHLENFGIKLNKTDALAIKDYNVAEAYPDWEVVNNVRKHLILEKEELVPYLGTYRCLRNIISLFGYGDSIDVREYYKNINPNSEYFGKNSIVSIGDYLDNGKIDNMNLVDKNVSVKDNDDFQKSGMLAIAYEFTKKTGEYDENGIPIIDRNDEFTTNEMFFKLHKMKNILERDYLPVNVFIGDVIGEWSYYISFSRYIWSDKLEVTTMKVGDKISISMYPEINHRIFDVSMLHTKRYDLPIHTESIAPSNYYNSDEVNNKEDLVIDLPNYYVNDFSVPKHITHEDTTTENFIDNKLSIFSSQTGIPTNPEYLYADEIEGLCNSINDFYNEYQSKGFFEIFDKQYNYVNSYNNPIGFPVILSVNLENIKSDDLNDMTVDSFARRTWDDIYSKNYVDIEWTVKYNTPSDRKGDSYVFNYTGQINKAYKIPQLLPYVGSYDVSVKVRDIYGIVSYSYNDNFIIVDGIVPQIVATYPGDDIFDLRIENLKYVSFSDFGANTYLCPRVNILDNINDSDIILDSNAMSSSEIVSYKNDTEVYNFTTRKWEGLANSENQNSDNFGFGDYKALKISDFKGARISDLFHMRPIDCVLSNDTLFGFWFYGFKEGDKIYYRFYDDETRNEYYSIPAGTAEQVCKTMNSFDGGKLPIELRMFTYYPVVANSLDSEYYGVSEGTIIIVAEGRNFSKYGAMTLEYVGDNIKGSKYTFGLPESGFDKSINLYSNPELLSTLINSEDIFKKTRLTNEYLMSNGFVYTNGVIGNETKYGYIPAFADTNFINQNTCKFHTHSFNIPLYKRVIFFVNNIPGKNADSIEWTLKDIYGNIIIKIRKNPYFIYNFNEIGNYELDVIIKDNKNNVSKIDMPKFINVLGCDDYINTINDKLLNSRK